MIFHIRSLSSTDSFSLIVICTVKCSSLSLVGQVTWSGDCLGNMRWCTHPESGLSTYETKNHKPCEVVTCCHVTAVTKVAFSYLMSLWVDKIQAALLTVTRPIRMPESIRALTGFPYRTLLVWTLPSQTDDIQIWYLSLPSGALDINRIGQVLGLLNIRMMVLAGILCHSFSSLVFH